MSELRPELEESLKPGLSYRDTYFRVYDATAGRRALTHGRLHIGKHFCAIGCYFDQNAIGIDAIALDEIAVYNDSFPKLSQYKRWKKVRQWLRFKLDEFHDMSRN